MYANVFKYITFEIRQPMWLLAYTSGSNSIKRIIYEYGLQKQLGVTKKEQKQKRHHFIPAS